ncbi:MAG: ATP-binding protein [Eubacteriales bacterium]|nr:ATP-binding protein [Eubacteriales bacterium]
MIVMDIKIDNFFAFKNFHMNMSYPKKIVDSYIEEEYLSDRPNFRYKKVNILMGANATGKTSFGFMLMRIFNFMNTKQFEKITEVISVKEKKAAFSMDFITDDYTLYRIITNIAPKTGDEYKSTNIDVCLKETEIGIRDSYESCSRRLDSIICSKNTNFIEELEKIQGLSWRFEYPSDTPKAYHAPTKNVKRYINILENTLKVLDPSIRKVEKIDAVDNTFVIRLRDRDVIIQDGKIIDTTVLSSGTKAGIVVAGFVASIINGDNGFYYCDEKFSYIQSDVEKAFLSLMIECLQSNDQLFFTTHNTDILDLPLPKHSFVFLKKDCEDVEQPIKCVSASQYLKRNTDSLRNAVDNDLFSVAPSVDMIYEIANL